MLRILIIAIMVQVTKGVTLSMVREANLIKKNTSRDLLSHSCTIGNDFNYGSQYCTLCFAQTYGYRLLATDCSLSFIRSTGTGTQGEVPSSVAFYRVYLRKRPVSSKCRSLAHHAMPHHVDFVLHYIDTERVKTWTGTCYWKRNSKR